jgi:hypothetical protein
MTISRLPLLIQRRLLFVVTELQSEDGKLDQSISLIIRVLSNYASVGFDSGSFRVKCLNPRMSLAAKRLRETLDDDKKWASLTINEHQVPLKRLWLGWKLLGSSITAETIWDDLVKHPMVTVTNQENTLLREIDKKHKDENATFDRYRLAGIQLFDR